MKIVLNSIKVIGLILLSLVCNIIPLAVSKQTVFAC